HLWLYEVYRRWRTGVQLLTVRYSTSGDEAERQREFDRLDHGALRIVRDAPPVGEINLLNVRCLAGFCSQVSAIRRLVRDRNVRLHTLRAFPEGFAAYLYCKRHPYTSRLITYAHGEEVLIAQTSLQLKLMARRVYAAADLVIANSENTRRIVLELCPGARVTCVHPGVDAPAFIRDAREAAAFRARWNWPGDTVVVCTLARMEPRKNHAAVIRAVGELRKQGVPIAHVCGSEGPQQAQLTQIAAELGVAEWVRFTGRVADRDKPLIYCAADLYAMPSIRVGEMIEGFGIVFLEAAAAGRPSVAGNSGGQAEAVLDGRTGIVVDGTQADQVRAALERLARDPALRAEMGRAGRAWAARHDWPEVVRNIEAEIGRLT
ncbi:MAG: glycosyltransferase family 4 protein, partial [Steroidobacteraceae bacterium]